MCFWVDTWHPLRYSNLNLSSIIFKKIFQAARVSASSYGPWISMDHVSMSELKCHHSHMHGRYDARYDARNDAGNDDARRGGMGGKVVKAFQPGGSSESATFETHPRYVAWYASRCDSFTWEGHRIAHPTDEL